MLSWMELLAVAKFLLWNLSRLLRFDDDGDYRYPWNMKKRLESDGESTGEFKLKINIKTLAIPSLSVIPFDISQKEVIVRRYIP